MGTRDARIDVYIDESAPFARPILTHLRELVHASCPDVAETVKWGFPYFMHHGMLCGIASFKKHCAMVFWKEKLVFADAEKKKDALGQLGRLTKIGDLPSKKKLVGWIERAMQLNVDGVRTPREKTTVKKSVTVPAYLVRALKKNKRAAKRFEKFPPSHKREYVEWITEAKRDETRKRRLARAVEQIAEGKPHNWQYAQR